MDLIRKILLAIEKEDDGSGRWIDDLKLSEVDEKILVGHLFLLDEAGLLEGCDASSSDGPAYNVNRLTWCGHDFLDAIRDENTWNKTLRKLSEISGSAPLDVVKALAVSFAQQQLGLSS
ncbi:MAG: DUF2513 domain-containing protein [Parvularculaceae bacterium]